MVDNNFQDKKRKELIVSFKKKNQKCIFRICLHNSSYFTNFQQLYSIYLVILFKNEFTDKF